MPEKRSPQKALEIAEQRIEEARKTGAPSLLFSLGLTELPESLGQLSQLRELLLEDNQLKELPGSLRELTSLEELFLQGNDALGLPIEVLGPTIEEVYGSSPRATPADPRKILDYYFHVRGGKRPLNEAKLILGWPILTEVSDE